MRRTGTPSFWNSLAREYYPLSSMSPMLSPVLAGLRILITRPKGDGADEWAVAFAERGAVPVLFPTLAIVPPQSWQPVDDAVARLDSYDWLVLTSQNAVAYFSSRLPGSRFPAAMRAKIAAVGDATAAAIAQAGGKVALVPTDMRQEGLAEAMTSAPAAARVLFPVAAEGRMLLVQALRAAGAGVDVVTAYRTEAKGDLAAPPPFDAAVFASPSALRAFVAALGTIPLDGKIIAVLGPTTAEEAHARGLAPLVAAAPSVDALADAISRSLALPVQGGSHVVS
jgi:uroporphyrinogen III methyltransferase/synthase